MDAPAGLCPNCLIRGGLSALDAAPSALRGSSLQVGERVQERYTITGRLGEGGFGEVYQARQVNDLHRDVAIKVLKAGMDTAQVVKRFDAERQALARIDHPNIATVYDAGQMKNGRPFFVMELVRGLPITEYAARQRLNVRERLVLMKHVCEALQHAHDRGIVHRDLKPSNILITSTGQPKVIDFGIAKALHTPLSEATLVTLEHQVIGTPTYMSPEQAVPGEQEVDARADVYALGVVLYELLVGQTPFAFDQLQGKSARDLESFYHNHLPAKPSILFARQVKSGASDRDSMSVSRLPLDIDWILLQALEAHPEKRYPSAAALAGDLTRHLNDEPVQARPPKPGYRIWKFLRRQRHAVMAVAGMLAASSLGWAGGVIRQEAEPTVTPAPLVETIAPIRHPAPDGLADSQRALAEALEAVNAQPEAFGVWRGLQHAHMHLGHTLAEAGTTEAAMDHFRQAYVLYFMPMGRISETSSRRAMFAASNFAKYGQLGMDPDTVRAVLLGYEDTETFVASFGLSDRNAQRLSAILPAIHKAPIVLRDLTYRQPGPLKAFPRKR